MGRLLETLATIVDPATAIVAHVGAHRGQECPAYRRLGFAHVVLIEPIPELAAEARRAAGGYRVLEAAVAAETGHVRLHVTKNTQRSSLLIPVDDEVARLIDVDAAPLSVLVPDATAAVIDVQGTELDVVASAPESLRVAVVETRTVAEYRLGPLHDTVDTAMTSAGWRAVFTREHARAEVLDTIYIRETPWLGF